MKYKVFCSPVQITLELEIEGNDQSEVLEKLKELTKDEMLSLLYRDGIELSWVLDTSLLFNHE